MRLCGAFSTQAIRSLGFLLASLSLATAAAGADTQPDGVPCGSGIICQGSGCSQDENNPTDNLNLTLNANDVVTINVTRLPNDPEDESECALSFARGPGNVTGQFTAGLTTVPAASGQTSALSGGQSTSVKYTSAATGPHGATINIGPPTSSAQQNCDNPANRKAFSYQAKCSFNPSSGPFLRLEKRVIPSTDAGKFNLYIKTVNNDLVKEEEDVQNGGDTGDIAVNDNTIYRISEDAGTGTSLADYTTTVSCTGPGELQSGSITDPSSGRQIRINNNATGTVVCTITNTRKIGKIKILKKTIGGDADFDFVVKQDTTQVATAEDLSNDEFKEIALPAGSYSVEETGIPTGWSFTKVNCGGGDSTSNPITNVKVVAGQTTTCTFTNTKDEDETGTITIIKESKNGDGTTPFSFTGTLGNFDLTPPANGTDAHPAFTGLSAGTYNVTETPVSGWTTTVACTETNAKGKTTTSGNTATIVLDAGEDVVCTFTNTKKTDNRSEEETKRFVIRRLDNLLTYGPDRARMLRRLGEAPPEQQSLKDGPMKLNGAVSAPASTATTSRTPGMSTGSDPFASRVPTGSMALGANPFSTMTQQNEVFDPSRPDMQVQSGPTSTATGVLANIAGQLMPAAQDSGTISSARALANCAPSQPPPNSSARMI